MKDMTKKILKNDRYAEVAVYLVMLIITVIPAVLVFYPSSTVDDLGHMANAALLAGYNWTDGIHSAGDYYFKYGTSIFYYLPMLLIVQPVLRYRVLLVVGAFLLSATGPISYALIRRYFGVQDRFNACLIALISCCPAAVLYQSNYARADWALVTTAWLLLYGLLRASDAGEIRAKIGFTILASFSAVFAYMCHTRGIVAVIALLLVVIIARFVYKLTPLHIPTYILSTALLMGVDRILARYFKNAIWGTYGRGHSALEVMDFAFFKKIFTPVGFGVILKTVNGWFFSLATSTYGLILLGFLLTFVILFTSLRKDAGHHCSDADVLTALFGLLNFLGNMGFGILFFFNKVYMNLTGASKTRADRVLYERYMISSLGILICLAVCLLICSKVVSLKLQIITIVIQVVCVVIAKFTVLPIYNTQEANRKMMVSATYFYGVFNRNSRSLFAAGIFSVLIFGLWLFFMRKRHFKIMLTLLLCIFLLTFSWTWYKNRYKYDLRLAGELNPAVEKVMEIYEVSSEYPDLFVDKNAHQVQTYQPILRDFNVINTKIERYVNISDMIIISNGKFSNPDNWEDVYCFTDMMYDTESKEDTVYVKGQKLKNDLEKMGQTLVPFSESKDISAETKKKK